MPNRPILVVQHEDECPPGHLAAWAQQAEAELDVRRCHRGDELPRTLEEHQGLIVLGGEMNAYDDAAHPWLSRTKALAVQAVLHSVPLLGICLGHQLIAVALGGRVSRNPYGPSRAVSRVGMSPSGRDDLLLSSLPADPAVLQWNSDIVAIPPHGAHVLARDSDSQIQILRFADNAWGIQGHPEVDTDIVGRWGRKEQDRSSGVPESDEVLAALAQVENDLAGMWEAVFVRFFDLARDTHAGTDAAVLFPPTQDAPPATNVFRR